MSTDGPGKPRETRDVPSAIAASLRASEQFHRVVFDRSPFALVVNRMRDAAIVEANDAFLALFGFARDEVLGRTSVELGISRPGDQAAIIAEFDARGSVRDFECVRRSKSGEPRVVRLYVDRLDIDGEPHVLTRILDLTEARRSEEALRQSREDLDRAQEVGQIGSWRLDTRQNVLTWSEQNHRIFGVPVGTPLNYEAFLRIVHPDDRAYVDEQWRAGLGGAPYDIEHRIVADGEVKWVREKAFLEFDPAGALLGGFGISQDITARKQAEEALRRAVEQLGETDRRKNDFLAVLSHELRNPLAPISNSLHVLEHTPPGGGQALFARQVIARQVAHLSHLVNDLLDVTRITRGLVRLRREQLDLNEFAARAVEDNRSFFDRAGVLLEFAPAPGPVPVFADRTRVSQIVGNLLQNAAKFSRPGGRTRVDVAQDGEHAVLRVTDDGVGIAPEPLARLFQPFVQIDRSLDRGGGGLGLGLALVKGLVELHGGGVCARSDGLGKGAELVVRLPLFAGPVAAVAPAPPPPSRARRRVLIVEDIADAADSLRDVLALDGHDVELAADGPAALAKARSFRPEIVLCDIGLPGMDGYDVARAFRADPLLRDVLLVALSGYALPEDVGRAVAAGFDRHVPKPPRIEELQELLATEPLGRGAASCR